jgi:tol-pal system protein YbgF
MMRVRSVMLVPVVVLATGACFATRQDLAVVQRDVTSIRSEVQAARAATLAGDSALHRQLDSSLARVTGTLAAMADTMRSMQATTMRFRGDVGEDLQIIRQQLIQIIALSGESQRRLADMRAQLEEDAIQRAAPVSPSPDSGAQADSTRPAAAPAGPGPAQLLQMAQDQFRRGSNASARGAFTMLLTQFPTSDLAPEALYGVAETHLADGNGVAADSVYNLVVERFPNSPRAPYALYKRANQMRVTGRTAEAQALYKQVVDRYPKTDAALLSEGFLTPPVRRP